MNKKVKKLFSFFTCSVMFLTTCITTKPIIANAHNVTTINKEDFISGDFDYLTNNLTLIKKNGDNGAVTNISATTFSYEGDVNLNEGPSAALTFGIDNKDDQFSGSWYAVNINKTENYSYSEHDKITGVVRMFKVIPGEPLGFNVVAPLTEEQKKKNSFHYKVTVDNLKNIKFYIDGSLVLIHNDPSWSGGNLGLLTFNSKVTFSNLNFSNSVVDNDENGFNTNLTNIRGIEGTWIKTNEGLFSQGRGDNFAISETIGRDFIYEGKVTLPSTGAASLAFRTNDDGTNAYVANVDKGAGMGKLFKFQNGAASIFSEFRLAEIKDSYNLKVKAIGGHIEYYIDNLLVASCDDTSFSSGKFGVLNFNASQVYQDLIKTDIDASTYPKLTNLQLKDVDIQPAFNESYFTYNSTVEYERDTLILKPTAINISSVGIKAINSQGSEILNSTIANEEFNEISIPVGLNKIYLTLRSQDGNEMTYLLNVKRGQDPSTLYSEQYRPQFHYSPRENWINDPNGMVYYEGEYHLFYQYYPYGKEWGPMHWGHAVTTDLIHWEELPIALYPDEIGTMFSGSAVVDENNTTGFFTNTPEKKGLVAIYTTDKGGIQQQNIAYSTDKGRTWTKYEGNPVIKTSDDPLKDGAFRDPKVFWHEESQNWMMVLAGGPLRFFSSSDLKTWSPEAMQPDIHTECPDLLKINIEGTDEYKWVLSEGGRYYRIGDFKQINGKWTFVSETDSISMNFGKDSYAAQTYNNTPDGRIIMINWMNTWDNYCNAISAITDPYNGSFNLQHELKLKKSSDGQVRLYQEAVKEYDTLRLKPIVLNNKSVSERNNILKGISTNQAEIVAEFTPGENTTDVGFKLRVGKNQETIVNYNIDSQELTIDRKKSGKIPTENGNRNYESDLFKAVQTGYMSKTEEGKIKLRIFLDWSSIEVFGNDGEVTGASLIFPDSSSTAMEAYSKGEDSTSDISIYPINSIWRNEEASLNINTIDISKSGASLEGAEFKLYDLNGNNIETGTIKTDSKGKVSINNLSRDKYILRLVSVPRGYEYDKNWSVQIDLTNGSKDIEVNMISLYRKVIFKDYDGKIISEQKVLKGSSAKEPELPTREGWTFNGWDKVFDNVTEDLIVTATYKKNIDTIILNKDTNKTIEKIKESINETKPGETININGSECPYIDSKIFEAIKGVDRVFKFTVNSQGITLVWSFNGKDIEDTNISVDLSLNDESKNKEFIDKLDSKAQIISFRNHGKLPVPMTITIPVEQLKIDISKQIYIYHFNEENKKAEALEELKVYKNEDGYFVDVTFTHNSDYFLSNRDKFDSVIEETTSSDSIDKSSKLVQTGSLIPINNFMLIGFLMLASGVYLMRKRRV